MEFERREHSLDIPNFKIVKKLRGEEHTTTHIIKSNLDVFQIFNQDLIERKK